MRIIRLILYGLVLAALIYNFIEVTKEQWKDEPAVTINLDTQVQKYADEHGIAITRPSDMDNKFTQGVMLGGAGGIASMQFEYDNVTEFLTALERSGVTNIDYIDKSSNGNLIRMYYGYKFYGGSSPLYIYTQTCRTPIDYYSAKIPASGNTVTFEKSGPGPEGWKFWGMLVAMVAWLLFGGGILDLIGGFFRDLIDMIDRTRAYR